MLKQLTILEVKLGDRVYAMHLPSEATLGEVHDALFQIRSFVVQKIQEALEVDKKKEDPQPPAVVD